MKFGNSSESSPCPSNPLVRAGASGQDIAARFWVAILRLVHVPEHNQMDLIHRRLRSGSQAMAVLHSRFAPCAFLTAISSAKFSVMHSSD